MELRQLEYFQAVGRLGSITKAAEQLCVAQPSVTIAIQKMEEELGVQLIDRSQRQIALTTEGRIFMRRVEELLRHLQDAVNEMHDFRNLSRGTINIGITPVIGAMLFPFIFGEFRKVYPHFELNFVEEGSLALRRQLEQGEIDIGMLIVSNASSRLETVTINSGQVMVCLPQEHPYCRLAEIPFPLLRDQPFLLFKEDTYSRQIIMDECAVHQFTPNIIFSSRQIETIVSLVEQGGGITFLPEQIAGKHTRIVSRPLAKPIYIQVGLAWKKDRYLSNATKAFIQYACEAAATTKTESLSAGAVKGCC
jgi:DNA-binding transcriptional LysR family regulator